MEVAFELHVDRLHDQAALLAGDVENPLEAKDVAASCLGEMGDPGADLVLVHLALSEQGNTADIAVGEMGGHSILVVAVIVAAMLVVDMTWGVARRLQ